MAKTKKYNSTLLNILLALSLLISTACGAGTEESSDDDLAKKIDAQVLKLVQTDKPGVAVMVVKNGDVILKKGYGMAEMEHDITIAPDHVFRLGSITKQFTSTAIMMLKEEGKLALDDEITKFLPDYPTQGHKITIRHLLTHTSGIRSYTGMEKWRPLMMQDKSVEEMIALFAPEPFDFAPGERFLYNNSGYFLLGVIIEKVSGKTYEEFIQERIFTPLEMNQSYYGSTSRLIPKRAKGYTRQGKSYVNSSHLSMTQPYAAGSLLSTVEDMAKWDQALYTDKLLSRESLELMWTKTKLNDGSETDYGFGWSLSDYQGKAMVHHGGGINGFSTYAIRLEAEKLFIVVLGNTDNPLVRPGAIARNITRTVLGK